VGSILFRNPPKALSELNLDVFALLLFRLKVKARFACSSFEAHKPRAREENTL